VTLPVPGCACCWCAPLRLRARLCAVAEVIGVVLAVLLLSLASVGCADPKIVPLPGGGWEVRDYFGAVCWIAFLVFVLRLIARSER
jgi:hypothetical protein